jgi:hypothetical protein
VLAQSQDHFRMLAWRGVVPNGRLTDESSLPTVGHEADAAQDRQVLGHG